MIGAGNAVAHYGDAVTDVSLMAKVYGLTAARVLLLSKY